MTTEIALLETPSGGGRAEFALTLDQGSRVGARYKSHYGTVRPAGGGAEVECVYKVATGAMGKRVLSNEVAVWGGLRMEDVRADQFGTLLGFDVDSPDAPARLVQTRRGRPLAGTSPLPSERLRRPAHDLFTALRVLADNAYALGELSPGMLLWDGRGLQIADLGNAVGQPDDLRAARDVRAAAGLLFWLASGEESSFGPDGAGPADEGELRWLIRHHPDLGMVLRPVFDEEVPTAAEVLARMEGWPPSGDTTERDVPAGHDSPTEQDAPEDDDTRTVEIHPGARPARPGQTRRTAQAGPPERAEPKPPPPPAPPATDAGARAIENYRREKQWLGQRRNGAPAHASSGSAPSFHRAPGTGPGTGRPGAPPGVGVPSLPRDFPFRVGDDGRRRPHPLLVWPVVFVLVVLILLVVL
ncbi:hypothetical protein AB0C87_15510 [Actinomadura sp. NPDC048021]|uniref:hypothetical protein n=1 Tax=Actinomadura sp. NPDC048021 TaxID=3155385 RepID=UPI0034027997